MSDKRTTGLYGKFIVTRTDGKSAANKKHYGCDYFVLDLTHDPHANVAIAAYADSCAAEYPLLARDLRFKLVSSSLLAGALDARIAKAEALAALPEDRIRQPQDEKDYGAGLIGQPIPDVDGTEPRPIYSQHGSSILDAEKRIIATAWPVADPDGLEHAALIVRALNQVGYHGNQPLSEAGSSAQSASAQEPRSGQEDGAGPAKSSTFLDWIDLEASRQLLRPRSSLTNRPLEDESWWQEWKVLRARIETQARSGQETTSTLEDASARELALEQALRRKQPPYVANGFSYHSVDDLLRAHEWEEPQE